MYQPEYISRFMDNWGLSDGGLTFFRRNSTAFTPSYISLVSRQTGRTANESRFVAAVEKQLNSARFGYGLLETHTRGYVALHGIIHGIRASDGRVEPARRLRDLYPDELGRPAVGFPVGFFRTHIIEGLPDEIAPITSVERPLYGAQVSPLPWWHYIDRPTIDFLERRGGFFKLYAVFVGIAQVLPIKEEDDKYIEIDENETEEEREIRLNKEREDLDESTTPTEVLAQYYKYITIPIRETSNITVDDVLNRYYGLTVEAYNNLETVLGPVVDYLDFLFFNGLAVNKYEIGMIPIEENI